MSNFRIDSQIKGGDFKTISINVVKLIEFKKDEIFRLGEKTASYMQKYIESRKVRPQAGENKDLENSITCETFAEGYKFGFGVGNIAKMNSEAPGWRAVNYGSNHMVGKHLPKGTFQPGMPKPSSYAFRAGRWFKNTLGSLGGKLYSPIVKNPIPAMNYIQQTTNWLSKRIKNIVKMKYFKITELGD